MGSAAPPSAFESVLAQVSSISQLVGSPVPLPPGLTGSAGSPGSTVPGASGLPGPADGAGAADGAGSTGLPGSADLSDSYGWPLEEGATVFPDAAGPGASGGPALGAEDTSRVGVYDVRTDQPATPAAFYGGLEQVASSATATGQAAAADAQKYLGVPYLWGGTDPSQGLDCSGLVQDVYSDVGISLPRTSQEQATVGTPVASLAEAQPGDLVFFPGSDGTAAAPGHVGIYLGNGMMIDAPHTGTDVRIEPVGDPTAIRRVTGLASTGTEAPFSAGSTSSTGGSAGTTGPSSADDADFASAASTYGVPEDLLRAVAGAESSFQPGAVSGAGAEGLMQLMPSVASSLGVNPFNPDQSISGAARLLSSYHNQFGSWPLALAAYNAGPGRSRSTPAYPPTPRRRRT